MAIRISGMNSGLDTDSIVQELVSAYSLKTEKYEKAKTKLEWKQDAWKNLNTKIYSLYTNISNLRYTTAYNMKKTTVSDATKAKVTAASGAVIGTQTLSVNKMAQSAYLTGAKLTSNGQEEITTSTVLSESVLSGKVPVNITVNNGKETTITIDESTTVSGFVTQLREAGLNASFDEKNQRFFISAKETGESADFTLSGDNDALKALGLYTYEKELKDVNCSSFEDAKKKYEELSAKEESSLSDTEKTELANLKVLVENVEKAAVKIDGSDAEIVLNGATYTSSSNSFSINGLTIEAMGVTAANSPLSITTNVDTQGIYDKIKDFLTEYNNIINELTKLYNADSAGSYEPLTDDEKEAMSEGEIEKWETKIKDSLLRRDSSVNNIMSVMMNAMSQSIVVGGIPVTDDDGKVKTDSYGNTVYKEGTGTKLCLSSFGIQTLGYLNAAKNEQNAYHIDGDEDDANTSGKADKLMKAIQEDPDQICEFMQSLSKKLYTVIDNKMKSTKLSSAYKVYNDKEMDSQLKNYKELISKWEERLEEKEEYYYNKFTAMETALSKTQSQTNALSGLFG